MDSKPAVLADVLAGLVTVSQFATLQQILQVMDSNFAVSVSIVKFSCWKPCMNTSILLCGSLFVVSRFFTCVFVCLFVCLWFIYDAVSSYGCGISTVMWSFSGLFLCTLVYLRMLSQGKRPLEDVGIDKGITLRCK
jgi:hypothetical protein